MSHSHVSGSLKQSNKKHKGVSASNRSVRRGLGPGRVSKPSHSKHATKNIAKDGKLNRLNYERQQKKNKRTEIVISKRIGSVNGVPKIIGIIPLSCLSDCESATRACLKDSSWNNVTNDTEVGVYSLPQLVNSVYLKHKMKLSLIRSTGGELKDVLDIAKVADIILFITNACGGPENLIDKEMLTTLSALRTIGLPSCMCLIQGLEKHSGAAYTQLKKQCQRVLDSEIMTGSELKIAEGGNPDQLIRLLSLTPGKPLHWRESRSYLVADSMGVAGYSAFPEAERYTVTVSGYLRGRPMRLNSLMHLVNGGTGRVQSIEEADPPYQSHMGRPRTSDEEETQRQLLLTDPSQQDSLKMSAEADSLIGEQTWPTEGELAGGEGGGGGHRIDDGSGRSRRNIPVPLSDGVSSYQADWFLDEDGHYDDGEGDEGADGAEAMDEGRGTLPGTSGRLTEMTSGGDELPDEEWSDSDGEDVGSDLGSIADSKPRGRQAGSSASAQTRSGQSIDVDAEMKDAKDSVDVRLAAEKQRLRQLRREALLKGELEFPDEMDTPDDIPARTRFARYRALQSFRSSPWHPKENLPSSYSRIFQFQNFSTTQRRFLAESAAVQKKQFFQVVESQNKERQSKKALSSASRSRATSNAGDSGMEVEDVVDEDGEGVELRSDVDMGMDGMVSGATHPLLVEGLHAEMPAYVKTGVYVKITLTDVHLSRDAVQKFQQFYDTNCNPADQISPQQIPCLAFALLPFENKLSVLHFNVTRFQPIVPVTAGGSLAHVNGDQKVKVEDIVQGKDELVFQVGFRTFEGRAIFSEANLNCDKHKMERFLLPGRFSVASVFGPVTYMPCPVLIFQKSPKDGLKLIASGSLSSVDPDRIVLKRIILTGVPVRVRKRYAVVKHLFHNPDDVRFFKPAELSTKHGLRGHIREPVGTHGLLKAMFNAPITQNDTVMLVLYKRVFPKFPIGKKAAEISEESPEAADNIICH